MTGLYREITEQPAVLERLLATVLPVARQAVADIRASKVDWVLIAARGSSDNAATYAKYLFGIQNGLPVALAAPSIYTIYGHPPRIKNALVIGISQSGRSPDIVAVLEQARAEGLPTLAITNTSDSPLTQAARHVLPCNAGAEHSVAATKTYTAELVALALLSVLLSDDAGRLAQVQRIPDAVAETLVAMKDVAQKAERYRYMQDCVVIGRGYNYATAFEAALKLKELTYVGAQPYSSADFMHGPIAIVEPGYPVILIAPSGQVYQDLARLAENLGARRADLVVISDEAKVLDLAQTPLRLPVTVPEWLSPVTAVLPAQLLAYHLALARGLDPDRPRGLRKITETF
mgnify:CR=1 FL=1